MKFIFDWNLLNHANFTKNPENRRSIVFWQIIEWNQLPYRIGLVHFVWRLRHYVRIWFNKRIAKYDKKCESSKIDGTIAINKFHIETLGMSLLWCPIKFTQSGKLVHRKKSQTNAKIRCISSKDVTIVTTQVRWIRRHFDDKLHLVNY